MTTPNDPSRPRPDTPVQPAGTRPTGGGRRRPRLGAVVATLAVLAVIGGIVAFFATGDSRRASGSIDRDAARELCTQGDMVACDDLLFVAPQGSEDQDFAVTCGNRRSGAVGGLALFGRQLMVGGNCEEWGARQ
ncbi:hypothetical protein [Cellulomonas denverensis]|uniref:Uncharacterized protein n=1 Tax=Cellulomonas denverensis TaxID=264297 RepID=A0A7X6QZV6_9CELL|nr:hypothetical protein [Cellulomonas denverensis]NKY23530.1 hypothetical protein [Cellulomonas denverensis]GIG24986.1 hypothetical protein Cde04nite_12300 [Cellulomonas denverensis]